MKKTCFIVGAGSFDGMRLRPEKEDLVIAADGGYRYLHELGIEPDILMGDFDSLELVPEHRGLIRHPEVKGDTDMALAAAYAAGEGYQRFFLYGGLGGRLDHTVANFQLLTGMARMGLEAYLIGQGSIITALAEGEIRFPSSASGMLSVFCMGDRACGVTEKGLKYTVADAVMTCDRTMGVSNEFTGRESSIAVREGTLLILWEEKAGLPDFRSTAAGKAAQDKDGEEKGDARALLSEPVWSCEETRQKNTQEDMP